MIATFDALVLGLGPAGASAAASAGAECRRELMQSTLEKAALRRGWIAFPEYWQ